MTHLIPPSFFSSSQVIGIIVGHTFYFLDNNISQYIYIH